MSKNVIQGVNTDLYINYRSDYLYFKNYRSPNGIYELILCSAGIEKSHLCTKNSFTTVTYLTLLSFTLLTLRSIFA